MQGNTEDDDSVGPWYLSAETEREVKQTEEFIQETK